MWELWLKLVKLDSLAVYWNCNSECYGSREKSTIQPVLLDTIAHADKKVDFLYCEYWVLLCMWSLTDLVISNVFLLIVSAVGFSQTSQTWQCNGNLLFTDDQIFSTSWFCKETTDVVADLTYQCFQFFLNFNNFNCDEPCHLFPSMAAGCYILH